MRNGERQATPVVSPDARPLDPVPAGQEIGVAAGSGEGGDAPIGSFAVPALAAVACHEQGSRVLDVYEAVSPVREHHARHRLLWRQRRQPDPPEVPAGIRGADEHVAVTLATPIVAEHPVIAHSDHRRGLRTESTRNTVRAAARSRAADRR